MPKRIPYIDEAYWEKVNPYLAQLLTSQNGGINLWTNATQPVGLGPDDIGRTGWNSDAGCLQRWNGLSWVNLQPSLTTLGTEIQKIFKEWNPNPPPKWLTDLILNTIYDWKPLEYPTWLTKLLQELFDDLELSDIKNLLNLWTPGLDSPVDLLIKEAMKTGGLTQLQAENIIKNWSPSRSVPTWLGTLITNKLNDITFSTLTGTATLLQIQKALNQWFKEDIEPWAEKIDLEDLDGVITYEQIKNALNKWFDTFLKAYINTGDLQSKQHADALAAALLDNINKNYTYLLGLINSHSHPTPTPTPTPTPFQYFCWPNTQDNLHESFNFPRIMGACVINKINLMRIFVSPHRWHQAVDSVGSGTWGNYSASGKLVVLPSSAWSDKSGVNGSPNNISLSGILAATTNVESFNCPDNSEGWYGTIGSNFTHKSTDNKYFVYLIWESASFTGNKPLRDFPMQAYLSIYKNTLNDPAGVDDNTLYSTETSGPSTGPRFSDSGEAHTFVVQYRPPL